MITEGLEGNRIIRDHIFEPVKYWNRTGRIGNRHYLVQEYEADFDAKIRAVMHIGGHGGSYDVVVESSRRPLVTRVLQGLGWTKKIGAKNYTVHEGYPHSGEGSQEDIGTVVRECYGGE